MCSESVCALSGYNHRWFGLVFGARWSASRAATREIAGIGSVGGADEVEALVGVFVVVAGELGLGLGLGLIVGGGGVVEVVEEVRRRR